VVGYMGNNVLPLRGGDAMRTFFGADRFALPYRQVFGTLIAERVLDAACVLGIFALIALALRPDLALPTVEWPLLGAAAAVLVVAALAVLVLARSGGWGERALDFLRPMAEATRSLRGGYGASMSAATLAIWGLEAATFWAVGAAAGLDISPLEAVYMVGLCAVFVLIPSGPGYLGTLDAAVLFGAEAIGGGGSEGVSFLLILRFVYFVPLTLGGLALVLIRYRRPLAAPTGAAPGQAAPG
jgi:glycosyltransferase 2 family protein